MAGLTHPIPSRITAVSGMPEHDCHATPRPLASEPRETFGGRMPISTHELVAEFGALMGAGNAPPFVGDGVSQGAGLPGREGVVSRLRAGASIPAKVTDGPLVAEYHAMRRGGHRALDAELLSILGGVFAGPTRALQRLAHIDVPEFWTVTPESMLGSTSERTGTLWERLGAPGLVGVDAAVELVRLALFLGCEDG